MERLTYYVNTGIQDVALTDGKSVEECLEWKKILDRLAKYEDLEESGRLVKLPCKVGDTVYCVEPLCDGNDHQCLQYPDFCRRCSLNENGINEQKFLICMFEDFEKTVFLTQEEAEAALQS